MFRRSLMLLRGLLRLLRECERSGASKSADLFGCIPRADCCHRFSFGLELKGWPSAEKLKLVDEKHETVDQPTALVWAKSAGVRNHYNETTLMFEDASAPEHKIELVVRAYADGVAFRYQLPEQAGKL